MLSNRVIKRGLHYSSNPNVIFYNLGVQLPPPTVYYHQFTRTANYNHSTLHFDSISLGKTQSFLPSGSYAPRGICRPPTIFNSNFKNKIKILGGFFLGAISPQK